MINDSYEHTKNIVSDGSEVLREANMGEYYNSFSSVKPSRDYYFPDKSSVESVVVMEYVIGSDLENRVGSASSNIRQFADATKKGSNLTFVMEAGGSYRWFTNEIEDHSVGRYTIHDGKIEKVMEMDPYTCMSDPQQLADFIQWTKENYPADRYMLVMWDHGAGLSYGFGRDDLNNRKLEENLSRMIDVNEIVDVLKQCDMKFDLIGFDACLMQNIEIAYAFEPFADYFLASEESEPAGGWPYTSAFSMLASDPTVSTEDFARELIGSYNLYNSLTRGSGVDSTSTLSLVDLTYIEPAYQKVRELFEIQNEAILRNEDGYVDISLAANNSYTFGNNEQIDLVHYLKNLKNLDYDNTVITDQGADDVLTAVLSCIVARNWMSTEDVYGISLTFPYKMIISYEADWKQLKLLGMKEEETFYSNFFSIMAASSNAGQSDDIFFQIFGAPDYTNEKWYVKGFENYVTEPPLIDIPIKQNGDGYSLELSDKVWNIIVDAKQFFYVKTNKGLQFLGMDYTGKADENGHPMISTDGKWVTLGGQPIYYEPGNVRETEEGVIYTGISKAMLNGQTEIILHIEWNPVQENGEEHLKGNVVGYDKVSNEIAFAEKGMMEFKTGDTLDFLFDFYNEEGKLTETRTSGSRYRVIAPDKMNVSDESLGSCVLKHGILLTDAYQRKFQSELVETVID